MELHTGFLCYMLYECSVLKSGAVIKKGISCSPRLPQHVARCTTRAGVHHPFFHTPTTGTY